MRLGSCAWLVGLAGAACVPPGSAGPQDSGPSLTRSPEAPATVPNAAVTPAAEAMKTPFEDDFSHVGAATPFANPPTPPSPSDAGAVTPSGAEPSADWLPTQPGVWRIEGGRLCADHARNHGIWLKRVLPVNARIEFDAWAMTPDGDIKAEYWGDGHSFATSLSYTNATSYLTIFGESHNKFHVLARLNEHGNDRQEITVTTDTDDPREKPVMPGQLYHFKVERTDGKTVKWSVNGLEYLTFPDPQPLAGMGHDHFGFNDWETKVCFDNLKITPLP
jgi:hypothetical protein